MLANELFSMSLKIVNLGLESFYQAALTQNATVCHVDWSPPAGGDPRLIEILEKLGG